MKVLTPNETLDVILTWFYVNSYERRVEIVESEPNPTTHIFSNVDTMRRIINDTPIDDVKTFKKDFPLAMEKLCVDGYIAKVTYKNAEYFDYMITFNGKVFSQMGGYQMASKSLDAERSALADRASTAEKLATRLNTLTFWLAVGTVCLFLIELVKFVCELSGIVGLEKQ